MKTKLTDETINLKLRDLAILAIRSLVANGVPILTHEAISKTIEVVLYGKHTLIRCEAACNGFYGAVIYIGWGADESVTKMPHADICEFDLHVMVYFNREHGFAIEGETLSESFNQLHITPTGEKMLLNLPSVIPVGFKKYCVDLDSRFIRQLVKV